MLALDLYRWKSLGVFAIVWPCFLIVLFPKCLISAFSVRHSRLTLPDNVSVGNDIVEKNTGTVTYDGDTHDITSFHQLRYTDGEFYDCPVSVMSRYPPQTAPSASINLKSQQGEDKYMYQHFFSGSRGNNKMSFVEIGALDGVKFSNSFYFEKELGWKGVLIEGETTNFALLEKNRQGKNVKCVHLAICMKRMLISLTGSGPTAAVSDSKNGGVGQTHTTVPCLPMHEVLAMAGLTRVDFYSIDVEGGIPNPKL
jgi:FkbM family methyltransferase